MKAIPRERVDEVLETLRRQSPPTQSMLVADTDEYVKAVLRKALGDDKANLLIDRILQGSDVSGIESLKWMDAGVGRPSCCATSTRRSSRRSWCTSSSTRPSTC